MRRLTVTAGLVVSLVASTPAEAFKLCVGSVVEVPAHPRVIIEGHDPSELTRPYKRRRLGAPIKSPTIREVTKLDENYASVSLDLEVGDKVRVRGVVGTQCGPTILQVVADWPADRSAPATPRISIFDEQDIAIAWDEVLPGGASWMRLDWATSSIDLARDRYQTAFDRDYTWHALAPGDVHYLRMTRVLADGTESASWAGLIARGFHDELVVHSLPAFARASPSTPRGGIGAALELLSLLGLFAVAALSTWGAHVTMLRAAARGSREL